MAQAKLKLTPVVVDEIVGEIDDQISKEDKRKKNN